MHSNGVCGLCHAQGACCTAPDPVGLFAPKPDPGAELRPARMERVGPPPDTETYDTARLRYRGCDIYYVETQWRAWSKDLTPPKTPDRAFLAFFRKYAEANPLYLQAAVRDIG